MDVKHVDLLSKVAINGHATVKVGKHSQKDSLMMDFSMPVETKIKAQVEIMKSNFAAELAKAQKLKDVCPVLTAFVASSRSRTSRKSFLDDSKMEFISDILTTHKAQLFSTHYMNSTKSQQRETFLEVVIREVPTQTKFIIRVIDEHGFSMKEFNREEGDGKTKPKGIANNFLRCAYACFDEKVIDQLVSRGAVLDVSCYAIILSRKDWSFATRFTAIIKLHKKYEIAPPYNWFNVVVDSNPTKEEQFVLFYLGKLWKINGHQNLVPATYEKGPENKDLAADNLAFKFDGVEGFLNAPLIAEYGKGTSLSVHHMIATGAIPCYHCYDAILSRKDWSFTEKILSCMELSQMYDTEMTEHWYEQVMKAELDVAESLAFYSLGLEHDVQENGKQLVSALKNGHEDFSWFCDNKWTHRLPFGFLEDLTIEESSKLFAVKRLMKEGSLLTISHDKDISPLVVHSACRAGLRSVIDYLHEKKLVRADVWTTVFPLKPIKDETKEKLVLLSASRLIGHGFIIPDSYLTRKAMEQYPEITISWIKEYTRIQLVKK